MLSIHNTSITPPAKAVYNSSSLAGQIAAVESGLAMAVFTQCSAPAHLDMLGSEHGLGPLEPMAVSVYNLSFWGESEGQPRSTFSVIET